MLAASLELLKNRLLILQLFPLIQTIMVVFKQNV